MRTIICDLTREELAALGLPCDEALCLEDLLCARDCTGCFGCWVRTPGACVIRDALGDLGALLARTDQLWLVSRMTLGWLCAPVKRALDRCLPYVHPDFRVEGGLMCHRRRYDHDLSLSVWLYGPSTEADRACARRLLGRPPYFSHLEGLWFPADERGVGAEKDAPAAAEPAPAPRAAARPAPPRRVALVNGSPRGASGTTAHLLADLAEALPVYARMAGVDAPDLVRARCSDELAGCDAVVVGYPIYVDALPSGLVALLDGARDAMAPGTLVYALANLGFYEPEQIVPSFGVLERLCAQTGALWRGGVAVGGGGMVLPTASAPRMGMARRGVSEAVDRLVLALLAGGDAGVVEARPPIPRPLYRLAAQARWRRLARASGADLDARP